MMQSNNNIQTSRPGIHGRLIINARVASLDPTHTQPYGMLDDHAVLIGDDKIMWVGPSSEVNPTQFEGDLIDAAGRLVTPGLIDSHTHLIYGGNRAQEFEARQQGQSYEQIARAGGGILSTVRATRELDQSGLIEQALPRLTALCREGVTTVEIKSGYGLTLDDELKMLRAARQLEQRLPVRIRTTLLAAHAVPPEYRDNADSYIEMICQELMPKVVEEGLADAVDVFCESIAFSPAQCRRVFEAAQQHGLGIKGHTEQLSNLGGSALAAEFGAWSVDHLEYLDEQGIKAMRAAGTVACLLPGAFYFLKETQMPPIEALRQAGVPMALASDCNPGSSPLASLRLMMNQGCVLFGLTPEEALTGVTRHAAKALGLSRQVGMIRPGQQADLLLWDLDHPAQLAYEFGPERLALRIFNGQPAPIPPAQNSLASHG
ncbi:imidazolonepropionase [Motiliproteus sp.]|uniref:imidazolonepropionase n=1 Tax=Motiliproteus sp. TaxID=1898955 RepID=UPI003BAA0B30